jgi:hypothetical protein
VEASWGGIKTDLQISCNAVADNGEAVKPQALYLIVNILEAKCEERLEEARILEGNKNNEYLSLGLTKKQLYEFICAETLGLDIRSDDEESSDDEETSGKLGLPTQSTQHILYLTLLNSQFPIY